MKVKISASLLAMVIVCMLVIVAMSWMPSASAGTREGTETVDEDYYWYWTLSFFSNDYVILSYTIDVQNDVYIDVMLLNEENFNKYENHDSFTYYVDGTDFNTLYTQTPDITLTTHDNYYVVVDNTDYPSNGAMPAWNGINDYCTFYYYITFNAYNYPPSDADGDGVSDENDAFPNDPNEQYDSDGDGVGDNADYYPNDPTKWKQEDATPDIPSDTNDDEAFGPWGALCLIGLIGFGLIVMGLFVYVLLHLKQKGQTPPQQPQQPYYRDQQPPPPSDYRPPQQPY